MNSSRFVRGFRGLLLALSSLQPGSHIYSACTTHLLSASRLSGATLNPGQDTQLGSAQPPTPSSGDSALKLPLDKGSPPKPVTTPLAASPQCSANKELVSPAEAPIILSSPRTSKTDSYDLVWRPRPDSRAPILYYVVKHRKVLLFCPAPSFSHAVLWCGWWPCRMPCRQCTGDMGTHCSLAVRVSGTNLRKDGRGVCVSLEMKRVHVHTPVPFWLS